PVRGRAGSGPRASPEDLGSALLRTAGQLVGQSRFAGACVADDDEQATASRERVLEPGCEQGQLAISTFEWLRRGAAGASFRLRQSRAGLAPGNVEPSV